MTSYCFFLRKSVLIGLFMLLCNFMTAQEYSDDFYTFEQNMVKCKKDAEAVRADLDAVVRSCEEIVRTHPSEGPRALLLVGELYKDAANEELCDSRLSQKYYRRAYATSAPDDHFTRSKALYCQGLLYYYNRQDFPQDFDSAYYYFNQAARYEDLYLVGVATLLQYGFGVEQDEKSALANYAVAIAGGSDCFADFYATEYTLRARTNGTLNTEAYDNYRRYFVENNLNRNWSSALPLLKAAAEAGYPPAMLDLSIFYMNGKIISDRQEIIDQADRVLQQAVKAGYVPAMYQYGFLQECQLTSAGDKRAKTMFEYYKRSAEAGYAPGQYATGICYLKGYGVKQDLEKAGEWVTAAVNQGYKRTVEGQNSVLAQIEKINAEKENARQERIRKWAMAMEIIAGVANVASQAMTVNVPTSSQHYANSSQVLNGTPAQTKSEVSSQTASTEVSKGYFPVVKIGKGFGQTWSDAKGTVEVCENTRSKIKSIKIGNRYFTLSENRKNEFLGVSVARYNYFTIINDVYYFVAL